MNATSPESPRSLNLNFDSWRRYQSEAAQRIAFSDKPFVLLQAPTGAGKSLVAVASSVLSGSKRTLITVRTKQLQNQYAEDFLQAALIWGRNNFSCALDSDYSVDEAPCYLEGFGCSEEEKWSYCEYYRQKRKALSSPLTITNIAYALSEMNYVGGFSGVDFLVFDEGHLLESELMRFASIELSRRSLGFCDVELPDLRNLYAVREWARRNLSPISQKALEARKKALKDKTFLKEAIRLATHEKRLKQVSEIEPERWVLEETLFGYEIRPIWVPDFGPELAFRHGKKVLIMSATLLNGEVYARQLGIQEPFEYIDLPSTFPVENRPINFWPIAKVKGNNLDDYTCRRLANAVDHILSAHPDQKGIVHTVSYRLRDKILALSQFRRRFLSHNLGNESDTRSEALKRFFASKEPLVLLSPSMGIGVDLADTEDYRDGYFNVLLKLPFKSLGDPQVKARMKKDPDWYAWDCAAGIIQSFGRTVRSETQKSTGYLLDASFSWFGRRNGPFFPSWFRDSVHQIEDIAEALRPPENA